MKATAKPQGPAPAAGTTKVYRPKLGEAAATPHHARVEALSTRVKSDQSKTTNH